jgi:hypothetical protein
MKAMINSAYGVGYQNIKTNYDEIYSLKKRIRVIELRKSKIEKILKND